ncbi:MAG: M28 family peptidase [Acidobacteriia bacterium]|nr:M28 family peptidase [Terriglobia bacterium]
MRIALALLIAASVFAQNRAPAIESIRREELKADLFFLASDAMRGRLTDTPEYNLTAEWIASRFARLGLMPVQAEESYYHGFDLVTARLGEGNRLRMGTPESRRVARMGEEFYPLYFSANGEVRGRVTLAGYGIRAAEHNWDDYKGRDVKGGIVMVLDGDPAPDDPRSVFDGLITSEYGGSWGKTLTAQEQGATAVLVVSNRGGTAGPRSFGGAGSSYWPKNAPRIERYQLAGNAEKVQIPALQISQPLAEHLLGTSIDPLRKQADSAGGSVFSISAIPVEIATSLARTVVSDRNVVARIEGSDPKLKEEAVIVSAHYDHNGADGAQVFNGADDNGSGTVAVLDIAEAYVTAARQGQRPKRTVIFAVWGSEERGLLGSWAWTENPQWPLDKTVASLNMDMIGRSEEVPEGGGRRFTGLKVQMASSNANSVHVMGYSFNPELAEMVRQSNREIDLTLRMEYDNNRSQLMRRSDQWPFLQHRVPSVFFHTGLHPDYHTTGDRPEKIEYGKMERITRLVYQASWDLAAGDKRPKMPVKRAIPEAK